MAEPNSTTTSSFPYGGDDSVYVQLALDKFGFNCDFGDLTIPEMSMVLSLALHLKLTQGQTEAWES